MRYRKAKKKRKEIESVKKTVKTVPRTDEKVDVWPYFERILFLMD
jgi:hypothetical protein